VDFIEHRRAADFELRQVVHEIRNGLIAQVVNHDFGTRVEQRRDTVRDGCVALQQQIFHRRDGCLAH
jgi:hypothetical protein